MSLENRNNTSEKHSKLNTVINVVGTTVVTLLAVGSCQYLDDGVRENSRNSVTEKELLSSRNSSSISPLFGNRIDCVIDEQSGVHVKYVELVDFTDEENPVCQLLEDGQVLENTPK